MMRRHLLALFALFTGLAALQAPAHSSALNAMVADASAFAGVSDAAKAEKCSCEAAARAEADKCDARLYQMPVERVPAYLRPPVIFGPDRALE